MKQTCTICGSDAFQTERFVEDYVSLESFKLVRCENCDIVFVDPIPTSVADYYPPEIYRRPGVTNSLGMWLRKARLNRYLGNSKPGRALEIGCGDGRDLLYLKEQGWQVTGTELSEASANTARSAGLEVYSEDLADLRFPDARFDVALMWHVIEHLPTPQQTLQEVHRVLKPNGSLLLACPNYHSIDLFLASERAYLEVPRHLYHFTEPVLRRLLSDVGFEILYTHRFSLEIGVVSTMQSLLNILPLTNRTPNFILDWLGAKLYKSRLEEAYRKHLLANLFCMVPVGVLSLLLVAGAAPLRLSPTIELNARRTP